MLGGGSYGGLAPRPMSFSSPVQQHAPSPRPDPAPSHKGNVEESTGSAPVHVDVPTPAPMAPHRAVSAALNFGKGAKRPFISVRPQKTNEISTITPSPTGIPTIKRKKLGMKGLSRTTLTATRLPDIIP